MVKEESCKILGKMKSYGFFCRWCYSKILVGKLNRKEGLIHLPNIQFFYDVNCREKHIKENYCMNTIVEKDYLTFKDIEKFTNLIYAP